MDNAKNPFFKTALDFDFRQLIIAREIINGQKALLALVKTAVPVDIACHLEHCVISGSRLLVYTKSACWASQIRFFQKEIINKIIDAGQQNVSTLQVRIIAENVEFSNKKGPKLPSKENVQNLSRQMLQINGDDMLQQSMQRLAATLDKRLNPKT